MQAPSTAANPLTTLKTLFRSRLSWRIVCWIFVSLTLVEVMMIVPSVQRRRQELLNQVDEVSEGKVEWIGETYPDATKEELVTHLEALYGNPMLPEIVGGAVFEPDGRIVDEFGEPLRIPPAIVQQGETWRGGDRYEAVWSVPLPSGEHWVVLRHDVSGLRSQLFIYILQTLSILLLISAFVTLAMMLVLWPFLIRPILTLRADLAKAGEAVWCDRPNPEFASSALKRSDELGEVITTFETMYQQICQTARARKHVEAELRDHNSQMQQYITQVNQVTQAAALLESDDFDPAELNEIADRPDELGQLARVLQDVAREIKLREAQYQHQLSSLQVEIDHSKRAQDVAKITESSYFQTVQSELAKIDLDNFWQ